MEQRIPAFPSFFEGVLTAAADLLGGCESSPLNSPDAPAISSHCAEDRGEAKGVNYMPDWSLVS